MRFPIGVGCPRRLLEQSRPSRRTDRPPFVIRLDCSVWSICRPVGAGAPVPAGRSPGRRDLGGAVHADHLSACTHRSGRLAERRLPARGARRLDLPGAPGSGSPRPSERGGIQLLPPASGRAVHDRGHPQLGRAGRASWSSPRSPARWRRSRARAAADAARAPAGGRPGSRDGAGCCCAATASRRPCRQPPRGSPHALELHLGGDRAGRRRRRRAPLRLPAARGDPAAGDAARRRRPSEASLRRLQERVVPALESLMSAALEREGLLGGVVETAALRRADT